MSDPRKARELFEKLLRADRTEEVTGILEQAGYLNEPGAWRLLGDRPDNYSTVGAQAAIPEAALVEKITNSIDAVLMRKCLEKGIDPKGPEAPQSVRRAVARFFEENPDVSYAGDISSWDNQKILRVAQGHIAISLTGDHRSKINRKSNHPSITIVDQGEGQTPENQPETLLSLQQSLKRNIKFQHGKFNMGGTAALRFCEHGYQLILSKRAPSLAEKEGSTTNWGFTIVRKYYEEEDRMSTYRYLAPVGSEKSQRGEIMNFPAESLQIWPKANQAYSEACNSGTLIKLYQYQTTYTTIFGQRDGLRHQLDSWLPKITLPVRLHECRRKEADPRSTGWNLTGLARRLSRADVEFENSGKMVVKGQPIIYQIFCLKEDNAKTYRGRHGVLFSVAGQSHGSLDERFFNRKAVNLGALRESLAVILDCSDVEVPYLEDMTSNSRDRLAGTQFRRAIEREIEAILGNHRELRRLRHERAERQLNKKLVDQKPFEAIAREIMRRSNVLNRFFLSGEKLADQSRMEPKPSKMFKGKKYPSEFHWEKLAYGKLRERDCQIDRRAHLVLETDVQNQYFSRSVQPGEHELVLKLNDNEIASSDVIYSLNLHDGYANLNLTLPTSVEIGDELYAKLSITDDTQVHPFINEAKLRVIHKQGGSGGEGSRRSRGADGESRNQTLQAAGIRFPRIVPVEKNEWEECKMDAFSALRIVNHGGEEAGGPSEYEFQVNMGNRYLLAEIRSRTENSETIKAQWQYALVFLGLGLLRELDQPRAVEGALNEKIDEEIIGPITDSIAPMIIPIVRELGDLKNDVSQESE